MGMGSCEVLDFHPSPPAKMFSMHLSAGSSPAWAAQEAARERRYMSCSSPASRERPIDGRSIIYCGQKGLIEGILG